MLTVTIKAKLPRADNDLLFLGVIKYIPLPLRGFVT